ncbi:FliO/MopB family protein [uncultured Treponema sp.]|uniref:FliO/MopB family protein n=1 Tax=uncultured Treponema sp. TaxID=162155 RepID=UPI0015B8C0B6|nr:flagellar biosynthetic protein FliO [uncultured Treponema sp.]
MKKLTLLAAAAVLFLCCNLAVFSQNKDSFPENVSKNQSFSIDTDPSQIQLNLPEAVQTEKSSGALSTVWIFVKMIFALAVVIGISWGIFHFLKKSIKSENDSDPFLRKVSQLTLSPGKSVQVITLQDNAFLIGVSDEQINLIGKIEDKELVNAMNLYADTNSKVEKPRSFREILDIFMPGSSKEPEVNIYEENLSNPVEEIKKQREKFNSENQNS